MSNNHVQLLRDILPLLEPDVTGRQLIDMRDRIERALCLSPQLNRWVITGGVPVKASYGAWVLLADLQKLFSNEERP